MECSSSSRMCIPTRLLTDEECLLREWFGLLELGTFLEIASCMCQQLGGFWEAKAVIFNELSSSKSVGKVLLATFPVSKWSFWKRCIHRTHSTCCPLPLGLLIHPILEYRLHQAMDRE